MPKKKENSENGDQAATNGMPPHFITVGIGASAGGIKALKDFFSLMPVDSGMAFVTVLHLSPRHESSLAEILQSETAMPVIQISETVKVESNHVYVIPPNKNLLMEDGHIRLTEPEPTRGTRVAIDMFFRTLAATHRNNAVCIVMSGTGSDGTLGLKRVKEENGFAIVQDPADAEYDSMPESAISTGLVDWVLPVREMPGKLMSFRDSSERLKLTEPPPHAPASINNEDDLREILALIRSRTGHDFTSYKQPTLVRRIARHLQIHELESIPDYLPILRNDPAEMQSLVKNLLINVTNFFRDKDAFEALEKKVIPKLFEDKTAKDEVRVWSVGCASGEEAYSIGILLSEAAGNIEDPPRIQVFATDVDDDAVAEARANHYPETIEADVSPERLRRFFRKEGGKYRVKKEVRDRILFAPHDILRDPPFSRLDLITCRNLLIYLNRETQDKVLQIFHFALNPGGFLLLGNSESAEGQPAFYAAVDKKKRIYSRRPSSPEHRPSTVLPLEATWRLKLPDERSRGPNDRVLSFADMHYNLVEEFAPASVLVNYDLDIVHLSDSASRYLRFAGGEPSKNIFKAVHPDLLPNLRTAVFSARQENKPVESRMIHATIDGKTAFVRLNVRSVDTSEDGGPFLLVIFHDEKAESDPADMIGEASSMQSSTDMEAMSLIVQRLEDDLRRTRARLTTSIEQYETSIEEMKASNEELQAVNEELRSASEELETGKEELQSVNEELTTVNQDLKEKVEETNRLNSDLQNLMASTDIGTLFLDTEFRVKLYTPMIERIFNIIPGDVGRPLQHVTNKLDYHEIERDAFEVAKTLMPVEREVRDNEDRWYLMRIVPYRTSEEKIQGTVVTFIDITNRLTAEQRLRWLATVVESSNDAIFSFAFDRKIVTWNAGAEEIFGYMAEEATGHTLSMLTQPGREKEEKDLLDRSWRGENIEDFETVQIHKGGSEINISLNLTPIKDESEKIIGLSATVRDISKRVASEQTLRESEERQRLLIERAKDFAIFTMTPEGLVNSWNSGAEDLFGYTEKEILGQPGSILFTPEDRENGIPGKEMRTAVQKGKAEDERYHIRKDGSRFYASGIMTPLVDGGLHGFAKIARDLTERKLAEEALRRSQEELEEKVVERTAELAESNESLRVEINERERSEEVRVSLLRKIVTTQEDERRRIARDIHDHLGQRLTALRLKIASLREHCDESSELFKRVQRLEEIGVLLDSEVNFLAWELRPAVLDDLGLAAAIGNYVGEWSRQFDIPAEFHETRMNGRRLDPEIETNLYRITQEALNNTYKHAKAKRASVLLERRNRHVVLIIEDDGIGFDVEDKQLVRRSGQGLGLVGMNERAAIVGGAVEIESKAGKGTTIFVRVPLNESE